MNFSNSRRCVHALIAVAAVMSFGLLAGTAQAKQAKPVSVFPAPKTPVASEETSFSFRGLKPRNLGPVKVFGSETGRHSGKRLNHSDGKGVSFIPKKPFKPGEKVKVYTKKRIKLTNKGDFWVKIGKFYNTAAPQANSASGTGTVSALPENGLKSRPDLEPPRLDVLVNKPEASPGKVFFATKTLPPSDKLTYSDGGTIGDNAGRIRWYRPADKKVPGTLLYNFQPQTYMGKPVLTYWKGSAGAGADLLETPGSYEMLNNRYNRIAKFTPGNGYDAQLHEFALTGRNTALVKANRGVKYDLTPVGGPKDGKLFDNIVQEIDIKTGAVLFEWHAVGNVGLKASEHDRPEDGSVWDYAHVDAITADGNSILISGRRASTIYRVNRSTAKVRWRLRGDGVKPGTNDFKVPKNARFGYQHDIQRLPNGDISLFDNGSHPGPPRFNEFPVVTDESNVLVLKLSGKGKNRKASLVKRITNPDPIVALTQGGARLLSNGNWFVGWGFSFGGASRMTEFSSGGDVVWDATFGNSPRQHSYRAFKAPWAGFPKEGPAIASEADGDGATVYASWNGSTKVQSWKVLTGATADSLTEVGSSAWKGLETAIPIASAGAKVRVVAYDADGKKLGQSRLIPVGEQSR